MRSEKKNTVDEQSIPNNRMLPVFLKLTDRRCLVVGGGTVAFRKTKALAECGALCTVVAPEICEDLEMFATGYNITLRRREYRTEDTDGNFLIFAATNDHLLNAVIRRDAERAGALVNSVDDPEHCSFYSAAVVRRGHLQLAVSSGGTVPALAKKVKKWIDSILSPRYEELTVRLTGFRKRLMTMVDSEDERSSIFDAVLDSPAIEDYLKGDDEALENLLALYERNDKQY